VDDLYWSGGLDEEVYRKIANAVLAEAKRGPRVVYVEEGHPAFYDDVTWDIYRRGKRRGLKVRILPAISCLDSMMANCELEIDATGLQIFEATSLVASNQRINPHADLLIMQVGWFGTSLLYEISHNKPGRFQGLTDYLVQYYPPTHRVSVLRAPTSGVERPLVLTTELHSLDRHRRKIVSDSCLFVRSLEGKSEPNEEFIAATASKSHLETIASLK
jgi:uncharacterized protein YabN with tetrapyrrole methylase and pyrophosphatase domain